MRRLHSIQCIYALVAALCIMLPVTSVAEDNSGETTIVARVTDSLSSVEVVMPDALMSRLSVGNISEKTENEQSTRMQSGRTVGYRVQIYSDNNQRTARAEAERRAAAIRSHFPEYQAYVVFQSPYWRVRVGDFRSRSQAEDAVAQMRNVLPVYGKEMRVVKDRVNID